MALLLSVLEQGMIYGILALGVYITYKILDFPDLTVDGSFPFGAAITVRLINGFGVPAILTLPIAFLGGVPVLAHPILYHMSDDRLDTLVAELKKIGLVGIEAIYSTYNTAEERQIWGLASKYDLKISGGSDFHGANKPKIDLGTGWGKLYVPDEVLENLRPEKK